MASLDLTIATGLDDVTADYVYEALGNTTLILGAGQGALLWFDGITIPPGATITAAYVTFTCTGADSTGTDCNVLWFLSLASDATMPATYGEYQALTPTTQTTEQTLPVWANGETYNSGSLAGPLQEVIDQAEWASGNAILVVGNDNASTAGAFRRCVDYELEPLDAPVLHIEYTVPATRRAKRASSIGRRYLRF